MPLDYEIGFVKAVSTNPQMTYEFESCSFKNDIDSHIPSKELCKNFILNPTEGILNQTIIFN